MQPFTAFLLGMICTVIGAFVIAMACKLSGYGLEVTTPIMFFGLGFSIVIGIIYAIVVYPISKESKGAEQQ